jgi:hypothetical protein
MPTTNLHVVKRGAVANLRSSIEKNIDRYLEGDFNDILLPEVVIPVKDTCFDLDALQSMVPESGGGNDYRNSVRIYSAIKGLSRYLARDERLWVWMTHSPCLAFSRERWIPKNASKERQVSLIGDHFFASGARGFERNNAVASLWWWAEIVSQYKNADFSLALEALLHQTDVRGSILERPTSSQSAFTPIMDVIVHKFRTEDGRKKFFSRSGANKAAYRNWLKEINRHGGTKFYEALPEAEVSALFFKLAQDAEAAG